MERGGEEEEERRKGAATMPLRCGRELGGEAALQQHRVRDYARGSRAVRLRLHSGSLSSGSEIWVINEAGARFCTEETDEE